MSLTSELGERLRSVVALLQGAHSRVGEARLHGGEARALLTDSLAGTVDAEGREAVLRLAEVETAADAVGAALNEAVAVLDRYHEQLGLGRMPEPLRSQPPLSPLGEGASARHEDGSRYPVGAAWAVSMLPPRVRGRKQRTVGYAKINGRVIPASFSSRPDAWADTAGHRLRERGLPDYLRFHVEIKLAALMIDTRATEAEVVINHAPCGSEPGTGGGCHETLEEFLPEGYKLTVHGSTANGEPFSHTYRGSAGVRPGE
ncbi:DddA-like double-stranded DNA deaminase toxin [Amycolatopsis sp. NPDC059027]|uniref:DddA-like double-stranded DNA deaminase toxin n=1 Tax=Amycolatopsis sp. NPDC059027 TaxID=3346709 RepID=UPI00366B2887